MSPQVEVGGSDTQIVLPELTSQTQYDVSISAVYPDGVSDSLVGSETTWENHILTILAISIGLPWFFRLSLLFRQRIKPEMSAPCYSSCWITPTILF